MSYHILPAKPFPLGAHYDGTGTQFAIFSAHATEVELCLFDRSGMEEVQRLKLPTYRDQIFCGYVPNLEPGSLYGYRCHGPYEPEQGHRFNPHKLLIDPYARMLSGALTYHPLHLDYQSDCSDGIGLMDEQDSAHVMPKCVVTVDESKLARFQSNKSVEQTVIYELHVKGYSQNNQRIAKSIRGTYRAIASDESIAYLKDLGVTAVELLPIHASTAEPFLQQKGLTNYWGYNNYHYFVLQSAYAEQSALEDMRYMTQKLHKGGIEVIADVVYNHTAEGDAMGPTYSLKGIDNRSYYILDATDPSKYYNHSGCGNSLNTSHPRVLQLVMDSLRYLAETVGLDGFRFDLASALGRDAKGNFNTNNLFFSCLKQDPVLSQLKLIAEPWDLSPGGYQLGQYPLDWYEWNDRFRDSVRRFWRGDKGIAPEFAKRMHGSSDLFGQPSRSPYVSINYISAHDGFTLRDLLSYERRHNEANLEHNNDGHSANFSANYGNEGATDNPQIVALRVKQSKNILASLLLAQGTPLLLAGDEFGNSQAGNNNAYCQDNDTSWLDWQSLELNKELHQFCRQLIQLRAQHPLINRANFPHGQSVSSRTGLTDISWLSVSGKPLIESDWQQSDLRCFAMFLATTRENGTLTDGKTICSLDDALLVIFNASDESQMFKFPEIDGYWNEEFNTSDLSNQQQNESLAPSDQTYIEQKSCAVYSYSYRQGLNNNNEKN